MKKERLLIIPIFLVVLLMSGCQSDNRKEELPAATDLAEETVVEITPYLYSNISSEDCLICGGGEGTLLPLYLGQENLGIININTFDLAPISINQYNDFGDLIEKPSNGSSTHITNTGENGFFLSITENVNRGYAHGHLSFNKNDVLDMEKAASHLCSDCLDQMMEKCWTEEPLAMGVIDFSSGDIRLFEARISAFMFGDYYVSCNNRGVDDADMQNISLLIFYCPERYLNEIEDVSDVVTMAKL